MNDVQICEFCKRSYEPENIKGVRRLKTFLGYTVDLRLQQFRKATIGEVLEFLEFDSPKGKKLLAQMHEKVTR